MIYELLKRDPLLPLTPCFALASAVVFPVQATMPYAVFYVCMFGEMGVLSQPYQRAAPFEATLPISGRELLAARLFALLGMLWVSILTGSSAILIVRGASYAAYALDVVKAAAIWTAAVVALFSVRPLEIRGPNWFRYVVIVPACVLSVLAQSLPAVPVLAACAALTMALLAWLWRVVPQSFQLAPAGAKAGGLSPTGAEARSASGARAASSYAWRPVLSSLWTWRSCAMLWFIFMGAMSNGSFAVFAFVVFIWQPVPQRSRWLRALPVDARAVLLAFVTPILLLEITGYYVGFFRRSLEVTSSYVGFFRPRHWAPIPAFPAQVVDLAVIAAWTLGFLLVNALYDWRGLRRISSRVRGATLVSLAGGLWLYLVFKAAPLPHAIRYVAPGAAAAAAAALAALWWALDKVFREAEYADKPRVPQSGYSS